MIRCLAICLLLLQFTDAQAVTRDEVNAGAASLYSERIVQLQSRVLLSADAAFKHRVDRIFTGLIAQLRISYPLTKQIDWVITITDDPEESASCMAGGKLLLGRVYVDAMALTDAELAMLLSHEMMHAALEHNFKEFQEALRLEPERSASPFAELQAAVDHDRTLMAKLAPLNQAQETEADLAGLRLAWQAGWPALQLANYFKKLARADPQTHVDHNTHPASSRRWRAALQLAEQLNDKQQNP